MGTGQNLPGNRGFDKTFALLNGGASHWPDQAALIPGSKTTYVQNGEIVEELPEDFYSSKFYTQQMMDFIESDLEDDSPFFAYLSYTAPHNPLHAPKAYIEKYAGKYDGGWDVIAQSRFDNQIKAGLMNGSQVPASRPDWILPWDKLTDEQQKERARDMEVYAAMIDYMDEQIGRILTYLKEVGEYENTLIVFISDNGPSKTSINDYLALGGAAGDFFSSFDNSSENKGLPKSSTDIGPGWAYAAATPLRLFKGYVAQGGIQVPAIIKLPGKSVNAGQKVTALTHVMDLMPTFLEFGQGTYPDNYNGNNIVPIQGQSLVPLLENPDSHNFSDREIGWEAYGMDAYRRGKWKILRLPEPYGIGDWQLYDLSEDPGEVKDLASQNAELVAELVSGWERYATENGVIHPEMPVAYGKPVSDGKY